MGEFVDEGEARPAVEQRVEVHLLERLPVVHHMPARQDFEAFEQDLGFRAAVGLDHGDDHVGAFAQPGPAGLQHLIGLADARRGAEEDLEPPRLSFCATTSRASGEGR